MFYISALLGGMEMLKTGCTTNLDHFFGNQNSRYTGAGEAIRAMRDLGLRHIVPLTVTDRPYEATIPLNASKGETGGEVSRMTRAETKETQGWLDEIEAFMDELHDPDPVDDVLPRTLRRASAAPMSCCWAPPPSPNAGTCRCTFISPRPSPSPSWVRNCTAPPFLKHLDDLGVVKPNLSTAHSLWIEPEDVEIIVERGATPVHNPASNLRLGSGLAPIPHFLAAGGRVALGADGACSNDSQNMFDAMRLAALIHNTRDHDFNHWITARQALSMTTRWGARAFGLDCGVLEPGPPRPTSRC